MPRSLSHQVGILTLGRVLAAVVMFFVPIVNTRTLTLEAYGYYKQFWLVVDTVTQILVVAFPYSLLYYFPRCETNREKSVYVTQTIIFLAVMSGVAVLIYTVMGNVLGSGLGALVRAFYVRLSLFTVFVMVSTYMDTVFVAEREPLGQAIYLGASSSLQALVVIVASAWTRDVNIIIWGLAVFGLVKFSFAAGYGILRYHPSWKSISFSSFKNQLSFALPVGLTSIVLILLSQTDKFIINHFLGRQAFAIYAVGAFQVPFIAIIRSSVTQVTFPLMSEYQKRGDGAAISDLWQRALFKTTVLFFPIFAFLELSADRIIRLLFTDAYAGAIPIFMIYLLLFLRSSVETGNIIQSFKKTDFILKVFTAGFFLNLVLSLALYEWIGRSGVPLGTVITMWAINVVNLMYGSRLLRVGFFDLLPISGLAARFLVAVAAAAPAYLIYHYIHVSNVLEIAEAGVVYGVVYLALCFRFRYLSWADLRSLLGKGRF